MRFFSSISESPGGLSHMSRFSTNSWAASAIALTTGSSIGSRPGGHGNGKVSKGVFGVYRGLSSSDVPFIKDQSSWTCEWSTPKK